MKTSPLIRCAVGNIVELSDGRDMLVRNIIMLFPKPLTSQNIGEAFASYSLLELSEYGIVVFPGWDSTALEDVNFSHQCVSEEGVRKEVAPFERFTFSTDLFPQVLLVRTMHGMGGTKEHEFFLKDENSLREFVRYANELNTGEMNPQGAALSFNKLGTWNPVPHFLSLIEIAFLGMKETNRPAT
jgi:hypothetical protein